MKLDKNKMYHVTFIHWLDPEDKITHKVIGRKFYRIRNFLRDLGYQVDEINEITI
ncbi:hypothetical protein [Rossellomorea marisflavi]|uniref:hypothetical protein n=1 Tax=Rossellomorea marisflavi TaxID=189381 RepID=UPI001653DAC3|nr:hypothetical protein [Rossellomorea marisflavi]